MQWRYVFILIILFLVGSVAAAYFYLESLTNPKDPQNSTPQTFIIRKGQTAGSIADALVTQKFIKHSLGFKYVLYRYNLTKQIQAGSFKISPAMSVVDIAKIFTKGSEDVWVTLIEGWRREETAAALEKAFSAQASPFSAAKFIELTEGKEGYLYPDTYLIPLASSESNVATLLENTFNTKVTQGLAAEIQASHKPLAEILTMASIIEREARSELSRQMVSGILWKRLENNWPLQVDATLQYAFGYDPLQSTWWRQPLASDKEINSPYNSYLNQGLPPGPICSPSLSAIKAALNPKASDYWFYLTGNDNQMHYAQTAIEHSQNITTYLR